MGTHHIFSAQRPHKKSVHVRLRLDPTVTHATMIGGHKVVTSNMDCKLRCPHVFFCTFRNIQNINLFHFLLHFLLLCYGPTMVMFIPFKSNHVPFRMVEADHSILSSIIFLGFRHFAPFFFSTFPVPSTLAWCLSMPISEMQPFAPWYGGVQFGFTNPSLDL